jgi:hypothetical protein
LSRIASGTPIFPTSWMSAASRRSARRAGDQPSSAASSTLNAATRSEWRWVEGCVDRPRKRAQRAQAAELGERRRPADVAEAVAAAGGHRDAPVAALPLRPVERSVGQAHEVGVVRGLPELARAGRQREPAVVGDRALADRAPALLRDALGLVAVDAGQEQRELVAADAREQLARPRVAAEPLRDRREHRVAGLVPVRVVDLLELVDVEHDERERRPLAMRPLDVLDEPLLQPAVVSEAGERVGEGELGEPHARVGVRHREADERGEARQARLFQPRERLVVVRPEHDHAPDAAGDVDGCGDAQVERQARVCPRHHHAERPVVAA